MSQILSQLLSEISEYQILYTTNISQRIKSWCDGKLRFYRFNNKAEVFNEDGILIGSCFLKNDKLLDETHWGCEFKVAGLLINIDSLLSETTRDISKVFDKGTSQDRKPRTVGTTVYSPNPPNAPKISKVQSCRRAVGLSRIRRPTPQSSYPSAPFKPVLQSRRTTSSISTKTIVNNITAQVPESSTRRHTAFSTTIPESLSPSSSNRQQLEHRDRRTEPEPFIPQATSVALSLTTGSIELETEPAWDASTRHETKNSSTLLHKNGESGVLEEIVGISATDEASQYLRAEPLTPTEPLKSVKLKSVRPNPADVRSNTAGYDQARYSGGASDRTFKPQTFIKREKTECEKELEEEEEKDRICLLTAPVVSWDSTNETPSSKEHSATRIALPTLLTPERVHPIEAKTNSARNKKKTTLKRIGGRPQRQTIEIDPFSLASNQQKLRKTRIFRLKSP